VAIQLQSGGKDKAGRVVRPTMNVTPLVDVVLVLLIIFMVMTPLMTRALSVHVPTEVVDRPPSLDQEVQVVLTVTSDGAIFLNEEQVVQPELADKLRRKFAARADQTLFFDADDATPYGRAVEVLDIARGIGLSTIAVLTEALGG
jgi:biopolymer transport protein ExbD